MKKILIFLALAIPLFASGQRQSGATNFTPQWNFKIVGADTIYQFGNTLTTPSNWPFIPTRAQNNALYKLRNDSTATDGYSSIGRLRSATMQLYNKTFPQTPTANDMPLRWQDTSIYTARSDINGLAPYIPVFSSSKALVSSLLHQRTNSIFLGDTTVTSIGFKIPTITEQRITFKGTPNGSGYEHSNIVSKRNTKYNYGSDLVFYTESKMAANSDDESQIAAIMDADGVFSTRSYANIGVGRVSFPFLAGGTYLGYQAGNESIPSSTYNTLVGYQSGHGLTTGYNNTFTGFQVAPTATTAFANSGYGIQTLFGLTTGSFNYAGAIHALYSLEDGIGNNVIGAGAAEYTQHSNGLNFLGTYAGRDYKGSYSNFWGHEVGLNDTSSVNGKLKIGFSRDSVLVDANMIGVDGVPGTQPWMHINGHLTTRLDNYFGDYSANYTSRSKIDLGFADSKYLSGNGTANYIGQYTGTRTQGISPIYNLSGKIGIGTTNPDYLLHVKGAGAFNGTILADNSSTTAGGSFQIGTNGVVKATIGVMGLLLGNTNTDMAIQSSTGNGINLLVNGSTTPSLAISSAGTVTASKLQTSQTPSAGDDVVNKTALDAAVTATTRVVNNVTSATLTIPDLTSTADINYITYGTLCTLTLPTSAAIGARIYITGSGSGSGWRISQNSGDLIRKSGGSTSSGTSGYVASATNDDCILLVCVATSESGCQWASQSIQGSPNFN